MPFLLIQSTNHRIPSSTPSLQQKKEIKSVLLKHFLGVSNSLFQKLHRYPLRAETAITMQSLRPIRWAFLLKIGFTSRTPMHSGISCLFASNSSGTPVKCSLDIILSVG